MDKAVKDNMIVGWFNGKALIVDEDDNLSYYEMPEEYVKEQVLVIAKEKNIKFENLEWQAAIHDKKGQPHAHIIMWDKSEAIQKIEQEPALACKIREKLIQNTYKAEFQEFFAKQNSAKNALRADSKQILKGFEEYLTPQKISSHDVDGYLNGKIQFDISGLSSIDILKSSNIEKILNEYLRIRLLVLQQPGSLKHEYLKPEIKNEVNEFIKLLLSNNGKLKELANQYVSSHIDVLKFYSTKDKWLKYKAGEYSNMAVKMIANALLQSMKDYQFEDSPKSGNISNKLDNFQKAKHVSHETNDFQSEQSISDEQSEYIAGGIFAAFVNLARVVRQNNARCAEFDALAKRGDLSKEAIKELIQERKDRGAEL